MQAHPGPSGAHLEYIALVVRADADNEMTSCTYSFICAELKSVHQQRLSRYRRLLEAGTRSTTAPCPDRHVILRPHSDAGDLNSIERTCPTLPTSAACHLNPGCFCVYVGAGKRHSGSRCIRGRAC